MQGIYLHNRRPKSKKEVKEWVAEKPDHVFAQATSAFGGEYDGPISEMPMLVKIYFVGPDPYSRRNFYGTIERTEKGITVK